LVSPYLVELDQEHARKVQSRGKKETIEKKVIFFRVLFYLKFLFIAML